MKRTTVFLDEPMLRRLKRKARAEGKSFAQCVREAVAQYVATSAPQRGRLPSITGMGAGGVPYNVSERVDEFLWKDAHD